MAYLDLKGEGDHSMPLKRRPCSGVWGGASRDPRDRAKAGLPESQSPGDGRSHPPEMTPGAGAVPCPGFVPWPGQPPGRRAMPSEGIEGDEWDAYLTLPYDQDEHGIAYGTRVLWRRRPRSSRRSHARPGRAGKPPAGQRGPGDRAL